MRWKEHSKVVADSADGAAEPREEELATTGTGTTEPYKGNAKGKGRGRGKGPPEESTDEAKQEAEKRAAQCSWTNALN